MRRSAALIAMGAAVAVATGIVAVGMASGGSDPATSTAAGETALEDSLPSGHPSIADTDEPEPAKADADDVGRNIERLEEASAADPEDVGLLLDLGDAYFLGQRLPQAERAFTRALHEDPDNTTATVRLAMVWHARGDTAQARETLEALIAAHPEQQEAHYSLAIVSFSEGRVDQAKDEWKAAARIDPGSTIGLRSQSFVDLLADRGSSTPGAGD